MKNKVVYLAPVADGTGYSSAANNTILGLDAAGVDVAVRRIKLASQIVEPVDRIRELENNSIDGATHVIQHILPCYFSYREGFKNIGYFHVETTHFRPSLWQHYCNLMDELWVSCEENKKAAQDSGVTKPIKVVPIPFDINIRNKKYEDILPQIGNRYAFYHIGDWSTRKNTLNMIKSYFTTFTKADNVVLVLKCYVEGTSPQESTSIILDEIQKLKQSLRLYGTDMYPPIILITDYLSDYHLNCLHNRCDCFVSLERGAAWNLPSFYAAAYGKWVITNGWGGQTQFIRDGVNGRLTRYSMEDVHGMVKCPYPNLYTAHEQWAEPDYSMFKDAMENAYRQRRYPKIDIMTRYDYKVAGEVLKEAINV